MFYVGSCLGIGVGEGWLVMIFVSLFMFFFILYLNIYGSFCWGRIFFGGGSKFKLLYLIFFDIIFGYIMFIFGVVCVVLIDFGVFWKDIGVLFFLMCFDLLCIFV